MKTILKPITDVKPDDIYESALYTKDKTHIGVVKYQTDDYVWESGHLPFHIKNIIEASRKHPDARATCLNFDDGEGKLVRKLKNIYVEVVE